MADLLIRDVTPETLAALDLKAAALGISRAELVRRTLAQGAVGRVESVTETHVRSLLKLLPDLANKKVMDGAWQ